jgi:hypothetical protein
VGIGFNFIGQKIGEEIEKFVKLLFEARKGDNRSALLYNSPGEDSVPLDEERLILVKVDGSGKYAAVAVLTQSQGAKPGEKIFFSRDADAAIVSKIKMLNDGSVAVDTDTETTDSATGNYSRRIKGATDILEKGSRAYTNEKDIVNTIKGDATETTEGNHALEGKKGVNIKSGAASMLEAAQSNKIKGGVDVTLAAPGAAAWCPNCVKVCPWGIPHGGPAGGITGLKGE